MASLMSTPFRALWWKPKIIAVTQVQAIVGVTGIRPAFVGALEKYSDIVTVDADDGKHKYCWRLGWELAFAVTGRGVQVHASPGRSLPAKFQAENTGKCVIWSLKFQNFPGEHAPDPLANFALVWPFHGHIALQTTLSTPLATHLNFTTLFIDHMHKKWGNWSNQNGKYRPSPSLSYTSFCCHCLKCTHPAHGKVYNIHWKFNFF